MSYVSSSLLFQFRLAASELRRDRADLDARLERLSKLCAETAKLNADSKARIARSLAVLDRSPSIVPDTQHNPELDEWQHRRADVIERETKSAN